MALRYVLLDLLVLGCLACAFASPATSESNLSNHYDLVDIVLVASLDGKFHALNRTSGDVLWSMSSFPATTSVSALSSLSPLVKSAYTSNEQEKYIVEPQSGALYTLTSPSSALQQFPHSVAELVDMSPFTIGNKVFTGRKEVSLLLVEIETGKIKATLNTGCPTATDWEVGSRVEADQQYLGTSKPREVYIARTDYHISIFNKPEPGMPPSPPQNISSSAYGPIDSIYATLQRVYEYTSDNAYITSIPDGEAVSFRSGADASKDDKRGVIWRQRFRTPIAAVFDVVQPRELWGSVTSDSALALLQPRPYLVDFLTRTGGQPADHVSSPNVAYVGLFEETHTLFAVGPEQYAFAGVFRDGQCASKDLNDIRCLVGVHPVGQRI